MSLDQYTNTQRVVIDLTTNPPQRYADRFALPGMPAPATQVSRPPAAAMTSIAAPPRLRASAPKINLMNVLMVSIIGAFGILLMGIVASTQL